MAHIFCKLISFLQNMGGMEVREGCSPTTYIRYVGIMGGVVVVDLIVLLVNHLIARPFDIEE